MEDYNVEDEILPVNSALVALAGVEFNFQIDEHLKGSPTKKSLSAPHKPASSEAEDPPYADTEGLTLDDILKFSEKPLPSSLLKLEPNLIEHAMAMYECICSYMGLREVSEGEDRIEAVQLIRTAAKHSSLRNELYMQLIKQSRNVPEEYRHNIWELWLIAAAVASPDKMYVGLISEYIHRAMRESGEGSPRANIIKRVWDTIKKTTKSRPRSQLLSSEEIKALLTDKKLYTKAEFLDGSNCRFAYHSMTTVQEALETIAKNIGLTNYSTFSLYEIKEPEPSENGELVEVHKHLEFNLYIADIISSSRTTNEIKFVFKKRMFRESDEHITEPIFLSLSYMQAQHDFLRGHYPVVRDDAAQMCALQIIVAEGPDLAKTDGRFVAAAEKYTTTQVLMSRKRQAWHQDVYLRYGAFSKLNREAGKMQFLRIIRSLPYGNSVFFSVKPFTDPIGLLPSKAIMGINRRGVHFFRPVPKEYLHSSEIKDIMQFGSTNEALFIKMKVAGVLHVFQFETPQGEEICLNISTHINDIMMRRMNKPRRAVNHRSTDSELCNADFGEKYEHHLKQMQQRIQEHQTHITKLEQIQRATEAEVDAAINEFDETRKMIRDYDKEKNSLHIEVLDIRREVTRLNREVSDLKGKIWSIEMAQSAAITEAQEAVDSAKAAALEDELKSKQAAIEAANEQQAELEAKIEEIKKQQKAIVNRLAELDALRETEVKDLQEELNNVKTNTKDLEKQREDQLNDLVEQVANMTAMYNANKEEIEQVREDQKEVQELLELKADIQRREREHAAVIEGQGKRIEYLDKEYKKEAVMRKKYFNQIEDLKGKIRVYCRVRPMLPFEKSRGQAVAVSVPDDMTITHQWKDEKKDREYVFDSVFTPDIKQEQVFESTKHLVQSAVDGYNVCIFAYGQTGSGKTFTIYGSDSNPGLTPRGITELFDILERDSSKFTSSVKCYMLELYQNTVVDLLSPPKKKPVKLDIKTDASGMVIVHGARLEEVTSAQQLMDVISAGQRRRHVSATHMNRESSRSHLIMSFIIECTNLNTQAVTKGKLSFVDLAGSERIKKSKAEGEQLKEAQAINKSLSALGNVIVALSQGKGHVPYKDNKLTLLMSDSIGGNAKTLMFVNVSPTDNNIDETQNSLLYATRVKAIKNDPSKILLAKEQAKLKKQVAKWKAGMDVSALLAEY